jgi:hypothetical protein
MAGEGGTAAPAAGGTGSPADGAGGGQVPPEGSGPAPSSDAQANTETSDQKAERHERELAETRREAAASRTKARTLEEAAAAAKQAGMTEAERATARQTALEAENRELLTRLRDQSLTSAAVAAATKLGFRNPELAVRLLDRSSIEWDDAGLPKGVEAQLRELAKADAYLVKNGTGADYGGGTRGATPAAQPGMNELLHAVLKGGNG